MKIKINTDTDDKCNKILILDEIISRPDTYSTDCEYIENKLLLKLCFSGFCFYQSKHCVFTAWL